MQRYDVTLKEALIIAEEARNYAITQIFKGSTQLENNDIEKIYFYSHAIGVFGSGKSIGAREVAKEQKHHLIFSDTLIHRDLAFYETMISVSSKFSLGNCHELAAQALHYILNTYPHINAELYSIEGGDHVILILNRAKNSNPSDPLTWGDHAVICDPWSTVNTVYKAADYLDKLKNYYYKDEVNYTENFNPSKHRLVPEENLNTEFLRKETSVDNIKNQFLNQGMKKVQSLQTYKDGLQKEHDRILNEYTATDERVTIFANKISQISTFIPIIFEIFKNTLDNLDPRDSYIAIRCQLNAILKQTHNRVISMMQFDKNEITKLTEHKGDNIKTEIMKFFGIPSSTHASLKGITATANKNVNSGKHRK